MNVRSKEHTSKLIESSHNGKHFLFHHCVILLWLWWLAREVGYQPAFLYYAGTKLKIRCISVNIKPFVMVWIGSRSIGSQKCTYFVKYMLYFIDPWYRSTIFQTTVIVSGCGHDWATCHGSNWCTWHCRGNPCARLLFQRLKTSRCKPITKPVGFHGGLFTFQQIDCEPLFMGMM